MIHTLFIALVHKPWLLLFLLIFTLRNLMEWQLTRGKSKREEQGKTGRISLWVFTLAYFAMGTGVGLALWHKPVILGLFIPAALAFLGLHLLRRYLVKAVLAHSYSFYTKPLPGAVLQQGGPYKWVRHPVYFVYLLETGALVCMAPNVISIIAWTIDLVGTLFRIRGEERLLIDAYGQEYLSYQGRTPMLFPLRGPR